MKVKIGKYKSWIGPYQIAEKILFWMGKDKDDRVHDFGRWLSEGKDGNESWLSKLCIWVDSKRSRTVKVHIDSWDTWNMDSTLAVIILPMLKQLKETKHGSPGDMNGFKYVSSNSSQKCFDFYRDDDDVAWNVGHLEWVDILDKIIWSFEQLQPDVDWEAQYWLVHPELDIGDEVSEDGTCPVKWKVKGEADWEGRRQHAERIQEGLELFGKYYQNLWD